MNIQIFLYIAFIVSFYLFKIELEFGYEEDGKEYKDETKFIF